MCFRRKVPTGICSLCVHSSCIWSSLVCSYFCFFRVSFLKAAVYSEGTLEGRWRKMNKVTTCMRFVCFVHFSSLRFVFATLLAQSSRELLHLNDILDLDHFCFVLFCCVSGESREHRGCWRGNEVWVRWAGQVCWLRARNVFACWASVFLG